MINSDGIYKPKIIFLGNPEIAANALKGIIDSNYFNIICVVTGEDQKIGRSHSNLVEFPVASLAKLHNIDLLKTSSINKDINILKKYRDIDYIVTCAFGMYLSNEILSLPKIKALNIHASLLPEGRGGAPINWAIINNKKVTGITLMEMIDKIDAGNYFYQKHISISNTDTYGTLMDKMSNYLIKNLGEILKNFHQNKYSEKIQDESKSSKWLNITKNDRLIDFGSDCNKIYNLIRGLYPKPKAFTTYENKLINVTSSKILLENHFHPMGKIISIDKNGIKVSCKNGYIILEKIIIEGRNENTISNLINGKLPFKVGGVFK